MSSNVHSERTTAALRHTVYLCPNGHLSSVRRPGGEKADRCFFCPSVVEPVEVHVERTTA